MDYIKIARVSDFAHQNIISYAIFGKKIGLLKKDDGTLFAIEVGCKHQNADLTKGSLEGFVATCHCHKWKYDLLTGRCLSHDSPDLKKYSLKIEGEDISISLQAIE